MTLTVILFTFRVVEHTLLTIKNEFERDLEQGVAAFSISAETLAVTKNWATQSQQAHAYPIASGGKRVRPLLLLLTAECLGGSNARALAKWPAIAIECIHTYSLVHDDLPCMDNDDMRRGRATTHKVYGEAKALLVGDGLLTGAFSCLAKMPSDDGQLLQALIARLATAAGARGMVLGQWMDLSAATETNSVTWDHVAQLHRLKTGELFAASFVMGALCARSVNKALASQNFDLWADVGYKIGLAFQIIDDVLDETQTSADLGKTAGKDSAQHKLTAVSLLGLKPAEQLAKKLSDDALVMLNQLVPHQTTASVLLKSFVNQLLSRHF